MAPKKTRAGKAKTSEAGTGALGTPPRPFKPVPERLRPFCEALPEKHVYVAHVDGKPRGFKRKIFLVPVAMNLAIAALLVWRAWYILPYYAKLAATALGQANETTLVANELAWGELASVVLRRGFSFMLDLCLAIFVWPWPFEFCIGGASGSPVAWRWRVGFRDKEIYVRRSREWYSPKKLDVARDAGARADVLARVKDATSPLLTEQKTGYLTLSGEWDLDWAAMVLATELVDDKTLSLDDFRRLVLVHHGEYGWMCVDMGGGGGGDFKEEERRRQVFKFRDALSALGKEDLFFRWIEMIQFAASQPGGFPPEKQAEVARSVRDMFREQGVDFDEVWQENVGTDGLAGM